MGLIVQKFGGSSVRDRERLLRAKRVALVPGTAFGQGGEGFVRASYCYSTEHILEALARIRAFLQELGSPAV